MKSNKNWVFYGYGTGCCVTGLDRESMSFPAK
jgi:hypothetical protein